MKNEICCIFNLAPHYRLPIYDLMDKELNCDFYIGDKIQTSIKTLEYKKLKNFKKLLKNKFIFNSGFMWQIGVIHLAFKPYKHYIITGSPYCLSSWVLLILLKFTRKKTYAWAHGMKGNSNTKKRILEKNFFSLFNKVFLYGKSSKKVMIDEGFKPENLILIYNSLDYKAHIKIRENLSYNDNFKNHFNNDYPVLIYIGRIQKSKKLNLLIQSLDKLIKDEIYCNLVFVGDDLKDNNNIAQLVNEKRLKSFVWFFGPSYDQNEIGSLLFNSDVCVSPGPVGLTALHCLTFGCPVISNDDYFNQMPEFEAIENEITGEFFENDNLENLTTTIKKWINLNLEKRELVRKLSYQVIDEFYNPINQIKILKNNIK
ncbi:glycosyltransferase [Cellulophaga sp. HaHaR_3_176]|uniref:glycosyltransferase n=1 Tax=Cellulophaga sp. HaHaR_3_176 TaxID=1942464 RepID=UPI001C1F56B8|nr:glycosyltransferase [Cellulophaga sp. HaHaR_3_176]QWX84801.1 glycosyltransferase [Cellulophaga sp. HaHaR_3_176]